MPGFLDEKEDLGPEAFVTGGRCRGRPGGDAEVAGDLHRPFHVHGVADDERGFQTVFFHDGAGVDEVFPRGQGCFLDQDVFFRYALRQGIPAGDVRFGKGSVFRFAAGQDQFADIAVFVEPDTVPDTFLKNG